MVFVYFAFWGLQEEFSTLPCSPCLASFRYPSDVYALSFEKYKGSNNGEFLKDKNVLFIFIALVFFSLILHTKLPIMEIQYSYSPTVKTVISDLNKA
jgi:hypothetical protein